MARLRSAAIASFLATTLAAQIPVRTHTVEFPLDQANLALQTLKQDAIRGSAVLRVAPDA